MVSIRTDLRPGDIGSIVRLHGVTYAREYGFDHTFEAYVAGPLAAFALRRLPRERLWIGERDGALAGCIAICTHEPAVAQLRWFLVSPECRGQGLGTTLVGRAVAFCRTSGYQSVILWTVSALTTAARLYRSAGFALAEQKPGRQWGVDVVEEKYELTLPAADAVQR